MEKRRRERINRSLEELKNLILDQTNHNVRKKFIFIIFDYKISQIKEAPFQLLYFNVFIFFLLEIFFYGQLSLLLKLNILVKKLI
jgi:hypothetical protein